MLCACVDIGSNTTRVLVADIGAGGLRPVLQRRAYIELGRDLRATGAISDARLRRLGEVVAGYGRELEALGVTRARVVATAAVRQAGNRDAVLEHVHRHAGVDVTVLDGEDEARLAFLGASRTLGHEPDGPLAVLDVGGGSAEIAVGTRAGGVTWSWSYPIGSGVLSEAHPCADPPTDGELAVMRAHADAVLGAREVPPAAEAVAVGGTATSLCRMGGSVLDEASLGHATRLVCSLPAAGVAERFGLDLERARLLPAGILILDAAVRRIGRPLQVGGGGLREGVCLELAGQD